MTILKNELLSELPTLPKISYWHSFSPNSRSLFENYLKECTVQFDRKLNSLNNFIDPVSPNIYNIF